MTYQRGIINANGDFRADADRADAPVTPTETPYPLGTRIKQEFSATIGQWDYVWCHCFVNLRRGSGVTVNFTHECDACGNTHLRFFHTLESADGRQIEVGIECARALVSPDLWEVPRLAENEVQRKEHWRILFKRPGRCYASIEDLEKRGVL